MNETTPAVKLRNQVVSEVVRAIICLTFGLYAAIFVLLFSHRVIPGELWLAAGNASGALVALLVNSKNDAGPQPVVGVAGGEPVPVDPQPSVEPEPPAEGTDEPSAEEPPDVSWVQTEDVTQAGKKPRRR